ncbi:MAG TPA: NUDIX hydrolase [Candidatus Saccharimonadales bacterium]
MKPWKRIEPTTVDRIGWRTVVTKTFVDNRGDQNEYGAFGAENSRNAAVIAITEDNRVLVARQFRIGPEKIMEELPGGGVDTDEDPQDAALRELLEETGYRPSNIEYLGEHHKDAYMNSTWHYYLATGCQKIGGQQNLDETEDIDIDLIPISQLLHNATHDKMTDAVAVLMAYEKLKKLEEKT